jgi:DGQHR domain-containing protein
VAKVRSGKRRIRSVKLSPEAKRQRRLQRRFKSDIRTLFINVGYTHVPTRDEEFTFKGRTGEIDGIFLTDNIIVVVEETTLAGDRIGDHLRKKAELFKHFTDSSDDFVSFLGSTFPRVRKYFENHEHIDPRQYVVRYVYCSRYDVSEPYRGRYSNICSLLSYASLQYFLRLSRTIRRSARYELFKFLGIELNDIVGPKRAELHSYRALLLPEVPSGFPPGHQLVSFLIDPHTLIERAYVLRSDSWRDQDALYQRLLVKGKIASMRHYLVSEQRVFVNNIIVTLPNTTNFTTTAGTSSGRNADAITSGDLTIPKEFNAIGIIDGQHRVFAYHEGNDKHERRIAVLRERQHLLVTGIIYPPSMTAGRAREFEAKLFLEINDKQKRVRGDLKQSIERIVNPYSAVAVAKAVIERMAVEGPLSGMLEVHFFDVGKIKTASIVSYGLLHIVDIQGEESLFALWRGRGKNKVKSRTGKAELADYVNFVATQLNMLVAGFKAAVESSLWTTDRKISRALSATTINGLIFCMRQLIVSGRVGDTFEYYGDRFTKMKIDFRPAQFPYKSSHWRDLGDVLFKECFSG